MYNQEHQTKRLFGSDSTMGLFVALYLILLTFFILLNAMSEQATSKATAAMESVHSTFHKANQPKNKPTIDPRAIDAPENDLGLKAISQVFYTEMEISGRYSKSGGNVFEVEFPVDYLFERGSMRIRTSMHPFMDQLLAVIRQNDVKHNQVAILFGTGSGSVDREMTRSQEIAVRRAGSIARYLRQKGLANGMFVTGFAAVPEGTIVAVFQSKAVDAGSAGS